MNKTQGCLLVAALMAAGFSLTSQDVIAQDTPKKKITDEDVTTAIKKAREYLWSKYTEPPTDDTAKKASPFGEPVNEDIRRCPIGYNGIILYGLLASGDKYDDSDNGKKVKKLMEWLVTNTDFDKDGTTVTYNTYSTGIKLQLLANMPQEFSIERVVEKRGKVKVSRDELIKEEATRLMKSINYPVGDLTKIQLPKDPSSMEDQGGWSYACRGVPPRGIDHSNTHFGFLGVWAAAKVNPELVPKEMWQILYYHYFFSQTQAGWWHYGTNSKATEWAQYYPNNMTAAGIANFLIAAEYMFADKFAACGVKEMDITYTKVGKALDWLSSQINAERANYEHDAITGYAVYTLERAALATGYKFLGDKDWYKLGLISLLRSQNANGSWTCNPKDFRNGHSDEIMTAFNLVFLARGQLPLIMNRLWYDGDWNNRPSALGRLSKWAAKNFETEINWQIVTIKTNPEQWHDTPVLLISGATAPKFTDDEIKKLREFVMQGGTILSVAECNGAAFTKAMKDVYTKMFPKYELEKMDAKHPIITCRPLTGAIPNMSVMSNRVRPLIIHSETDIVAAWQASAVTTGKISFDVAASIVMYVGGGKTLRNRGTSPWPDKPTTWPDKKVKLVRLAYSGNSDPEPMAWERMRWKLADENLLTIETAADPIAIKDLPASQAQIAVLTGTQTLKLEDGDAAAIKSYVQAGGLLIVDSAGGSQKFEESARKVIGDIFGGEEKLEGLSIDSPLFASLPKDFKVKYRTGSSRGRGNALRMLCVMNNGKPGVVFSGDDLTAGVLGVKSLSVDGYQPEVAFELARSIVIYASGQPAPSASAAPAAPATEATPTTPTSAPAAN